VNRNGLGGAPRLRVSTEVMIVPTSNARLSAHQGRGLKLLFWSVIVTIAAVVISPQPAHGASNVKCQLSFTMSGWSAFYKTASGKGTVTCDNGQSMKVKLNAKGGGLTVGKSTIEDGHGEFSGVGSVSEILGSYIAAEAHAGAVESTQAQVMTKGEVSLALAGKGRGFDLGVAFGKLTISKG
jgi:hypothetical protein